jgi:hypothetical protein
MVKYQSVFFLEKERVNKDVKRVISAFSDLHLLLVGLLLLFLLKLKLENFLFFFGN